ncbi:MAG: PAS domain S-box protein, partial [Sphingomonadales bacterium]
MKRSGGEVVTADLRARGERRGPDRVNGERSGGLQQAIDEPASEQNFFLPREAGGMTLFLLAAYGIALVVHQGLPSTLTISFALASAALFACGSLFAETERRAATALRLTIVFVGIVLPMTCAGLALAIWVGEGLPWQWAIATLVCINAAAAALFDMRIISLFCAKIASWTGFAMLVPQQGTFAAVIAAAITLMLIARLEWKAAEKRREAREARERVAARAEDILRSFEETGQGWFWETDRRGLITYISPKAATVLGKTTDEVVGCPLSEIVDPTTGAADAERARLHGAFELAQRTVR